MKKHYIIPIFVPHLGCPNDCILQSKVNKWTAKNDNK